MRNKKPNFYQHAIRCGVNMNGKQAVPTCRALGRIAAVDIEDLETCEMVIPAGFRICKVAHRWIKAQGMDYVIVEK
jgi:hypothetical protein